MTTPAAWHPDPTGVFDHRYWDGSRWTEHVAVRGARGTSAVEADPVQAQRVAATLAPRTPAPAPAAPATPTPAMTAAAPPTAAPARPVPADAYAITLPAGGPRGAGPPTGPMLSAARPAPRPASAGHSHDGWLWALVGVPVALGLAQLVIGYDLALLAVLVLAATIGNVGAALLDMRANPAITTRESTTVLAVAAFLLAPLYVFLRQRRLGRSQLPLLGYLAVAAVMTVLPIVVGAANVIDEPRLERQIEAWVRDSFDTHVRVDCPAGQPARSGHRFLCRVDDGMGGANVRVEVLNRAGDVEWIVIG